MSLYRGLRGIGLHLLGQIKQGDGGFPRLGLCKELDQERNNPRGSCAVATATYAGEKVIAVAWKGKSNRSKKEKGILDEHIHCFGLHNYTPW